MFKQYLGGRLFLYASAIFIIAVTIWFVNNLSARIEQEETKKVATWVAATRTLFVSSPTDANLNLAIEIVTNNNTIPLILTDQDGNIIDSRNLDSTRIMRDPHYLAHELADFKKQHPPFRMEIDHNLKLYNSIYYGDSYILKMVRYYPYIQLAVVAVFIGVVLLALSSTNRATQNQVWVGWAKETAHQLGTPLSSIEAWLEMLKTNPDNDPFVSELQKDLDRLKLIADRFSKIGSVPRLEETEVGQQIEYMVSYMRKRASQKVQFYVEPHEQPVMAMLSPPLFDWVLENLLKNALDAMESGMGEISVRMEEHPGHLIIDVHDTGKGIPKANFEKVFKPGFSTKKRGWGLGLSLARRIIEDYHKGRIYVKSSEAGKGTTFRIWLKK
ncbi:sensor histidine kinase [Chitinophaga parva]|uniref:histidine kinase n=1 Tax=Chitinophaga parva TaxID=2169414 RepID=A0A2T7BPR1_9BACT|nr:HAMP domain-containing sensor histidine kinase [Chitinophaga parva]PUZ29652.1 sensor histidine kinase [Chitinophaga parva]